MAATFDASKFLNELVGSAKGREIYSVTRLTSEVKSILEGRFGGVWLEGEISNLKRHQSGHIYLSLKDDNAQISAAIFKNIARKIKFDLEDGQKVLAFGRVSVYAIRGNYQIIIEHLEPRGLGALQLAFQQLKEKLEKEGLFDRRHKKSIPAMPRRIGIITSPTGAAIRDILTVIQRRFPNVEIDIYPVRVQGKEAKNEIADAIVDMNRWDLADVLIIGRGGGSLEDLWAFNEEVVARAIFDSKIPVISAVGHEVDFTIADFVSDLRAPTPSAAAELAVPRLDEIVWKIQNASQTIRQGLINRIERGRMRLNRLSSASPFTRPFDRIQTEQQRLDDLTSEIHTALKNCLALKTQKLRTAAGRLESLSPLKVLARGYSVTKSSDGAVIRNAFEAKPGSMIITTTAHGRIQSKVEKIIPEEESNGKS